MENLVNEHPDLELVCERAFTNVCLRYTGQMSYEDDINLFNRKLRQKIVQSGNFMVSLANVGSKVVLRPVICNPATDSKSLTGFISEIIDVASMID